MCVCVFVDLIVTIIWYSMLKAYSRSFKIYRGERLIALAKLLLLFVFFGFGFGHFADTHNSNKWIGHKSSAKRRRSHVYISNLLTHRQIMLESQNSNSLHCSQFQWVAYFSCSYGLMYAMRQHGTDSSFRWCNLLVFYSNPNGHITKFWL